MDDAVHRLREQLPVPGVVVSEERAALISEAERDLIATWVRYLRAYDAVHAE